jgi:hypothetical protein
MKFFFPDSQDVVDPSFDFDTESRSKNRIRLQHDLYAHEVLSPPPYDGMLVSKSVVEGVGTAKYTMGQRLRFRLGGVHDFLRVPTLPNGKRLAVMGDCGAFNYVKEEVPPYTVEEVAEFYLDCGFDYGISVDHVILDYQPRWDAEKSVPPEVEARQAITLQYAEKFLALHKREQFPFTALGVAQGWSPQSYATAVDALQKMGYQYIALGGMVPLKTQEILQCLETVDSVRQSTTALHLLGVTRIDHVKTYERFGVASIDSTSPLKMAFKDNKDNYWHGDLRYSAIRIPQVDGNPKLLKKTRSGVVPQDQAIRLERACLQAMRDFDRGLITVDATVAVLTEYEALCDDKGRSLYGQSYRELLEARPWRECACDICRDIGYHVVLFRGAERNRRRGFHNLAVFYNTLQERLAREPALPAQQLDMFSALPLTS